MKDDADYVGEYASIIRAAAREGWLRELLAAHWTPCDQDDAIRLLSWVRSLVGTRRLPADLKLRFTNKRGRARFNKKTRRYSISLPKAPGTTFARLRAGLVLHEAAHVVDRCSTGVFNHKSTFQRVLRALVTHSEWRTHVMSGTVREIYGRHRGPYSLLLGRERPVKGGGMEQYTDRLSKRFNAEDAHEEARMLVTDPRENVTDVHVFSDSEGQFTGAFYTRGVAYESWAELRARDLAETGFDNPWEQTKETNDGRVEPHCGDDADPGPGEPGEAEAALLQEPVEPVREVAAGDERRVPAKPAPRVRPVRSVPPQGEAATGAKRKGVNLGIAADKIDGWPGSKGAGIVRAALIEIGEAGISAAELAKRLADPLKEAGVEFPASLISRLKQGGFIHVVTEKE